jgi:hypothetical protein
MLGLTSRSMLLALLCAALCVTAHAQAPTGIILGTVTDASGAVIPGAPVTITNKDTNSPRSVTTGADGTFSAPALPPGNYEVRAEIKGFRTLVRPAQVLAGSPTTVDMAMSVGATNDVVTVEGAAAQINYDNNTIAGVIERQTIEDIPLNGRSSLQLAQLEPGVTVAPGSPSQFNALFNVNILGGTGNYGIGPLITMDGGVINDEMEGGTSMNFSQEVVQEFQLSSVNYDISTGITSSGAINIVTRSGTNDFHGAAYFYFRDHNMAAYPGLQRNTLDPDPFFARRNPGLNVGGPIIKDKLFFFFSYEHMNQSSVFVVPETLPSTQGISGVFGSPLIYNWYDARFDYRLSAKHNFFMRYSHDGNNAFAPYVGSSQPANWNYNINWSDQSIMGLTSTLTPNLVSDFRFQYHYWQNNVTNATAANCVFPCIGSGLPAILSLIGSPSPFATGVGINSPQYRQARSFQPREDLTWQKGAHRLKAGINYEFMKTKVVPWDFCNPGCMELWAPEEITSIFGAATPFVFPNLPTTINSTASLLNLPVYNGTSSIYQGFGVGNGTFPGGYQHGEGATNQRIGAYVGDTWKVKDNLTVNYGLGYEVETGLFYSNIPLPQYLAPILEGQTDGLPYGLTPTAQNKLDFSPSVGFAWSIGKSKKTVIRGGGGIYWDTNPIWEHFREGASIGPVGDGRTTLAASAFTNTLPGIVNYTAGGSPVPVGTALPINALTNMTLGQFLQIYNTEFPALEAALAPTPQSSGSYSVAGINVAKQGIEIYPSKFPLTRSYQTSIGVQRELPANMIINIDWARRQFENTQINEVDVNLYGRMMPGPNGTPVPDPVIPACTGTQASVVTAECSTGSITMWDPEGRSVYDGLLIKLVKRYSHHYNFVASYALQKLVSITEVSAVNMFAGYGPTLAPQQLNLAGQVTLKWGFRLSLNSFMSSATPNIPIINTFDISNSGQSSTPISSLVPGIGFNCFSGGGCSNSQITSAVNYLNAHWAGKTDAAGNVFPTIAMPTSLTLGRPIFSQDLSLKKEFAYRERYKLTVQYDVFNVLNISNLTGYSNALNAPGFGVATTRLGANSPFGSGGPRAMQVGARFSF